MIDRATPRSRGRTKRLRAAGLEVAAVGLSASLLYVAVGSVATADSSASPEASAPSVLSAEALSEIANSSTPPGNQLAQGGDLSAEQLARVQALVDAKAVLTRLLQPLGVVPSITRAGRWSSSDGSRQLGFVVELSFGRALDLPITLFPSMNYNDATDTWTPATYAASVKGLSRAMLLMDLGGTIAQLTPLDGEESPLPGQHVERTSND
jgi:hypothetical protein